MHYVFGFVIVGAMLAVVAVGLSSAAAFVTDDGIRAAFRGFTAGAIHFKPFLQTVGR